MALNAATMKLIMDSEGFVDHWYPDPATGGKPYTCCFGHTDAAGKPTYASSKAKRFTRTQGEDILAADLLKVETQVRAAVKVPLNSNQLGALVSLTYNIGLGNFRSSTLLRLLNAGDYAGAAAEFPRWNKAAGKTMTGLITRRAAEARLFRTPVSAGEISQQPVPAPTKKPANKAGLIIVALLVIAAIAFFIFKH
ncbi:MAG TPA: lysozyme [Sphingomicrobium sp.]|nr:lysozyme [Sphingomicrobium sp.]